MNTPLDPLPYRYIQKAVNSLRTTLDTLYDEGHVRYGAYSELVERLLDIEDEILQP